MWRSFHQTLYVYFSGWVQVLWTWYHIVTRSILIQKNQTISPILLKILMEDILNQRGKGYNVITDNIFLHIFQSLDGQRFGPDHILARLDPYSSNEPYFFSTIFLQIQESWTTVSLCQQFCKTYHSLFAFLRLFVTLTIEFRDLMSAEGVKSGTSLASQRLHIS